MRFLRLSIVCLSLNVFANNPASTNPNSPQIINNSDVSMHFLINGGKTNESCGLIGIGEGTIAPKQIIKQLEYKNQTEINYLCIMLAPEQNSQDSTIIKAVVSNKCIISIEANHKITTSKECKPNEHNDK